jgi:hypothetical protein
MTMKNGIFLKTVASNLTISDRHLSAEPRDASQLVVDQGRLAQSNTAPSRDDAVLVGETDPDLQMRRGRDSKWLKSAISF